jgi:hypothetical protein
MQTIHANAAQVSLRRDVECLPEAELQAASADADGRGKFINTDRLTERLRNAECASACHVPLACCDEFSFIVRTRQELGDGGQQL